MSLDVENEKNSNPFVTVKKRNAIVVQLCWLYYKMGIPIFQDCFHLSSQTMTNTVWLVPRPAAISEMTNVRFTFHALASAFLTAKKSVTATHARWLGYDSLALSDAYIIQRKIQFKIRPGLHV